MKDWILDIMEKGEWYTRPAISDLSNVSRRNVPLLLDELVKDGLVVKRSCGQALEFSLAITTPKTLIGAPSNALRTQPTSPTPRLSIAGTAYRPKWKGLKSYDSYALSHQRLCEEVR